MNSADIDMQIVSRDGAVVLLFSRYYDDEGSRPAFTDNMTMDPETAMRASAVLADMAFEADPGIKPIGPAQKAVLVEKHRSVLIPRIASMLNSLREAKKVSNHQLSVQIMDAVCSEVFS